MQDADTFRQSVEEAEMSNFKLVAQPTKVMLWLVSKCTYIHADEDFVNDVWCVLLLHVS